eukprot:m.199081 g.199081  ORF g.199081 m.199081 type:complete len:95 (-) comp53801_c0_seq7:216-500(-)
MRRKFGSAKPSILAIVFLSRSTDEPVPPRVPLRWTFVFLKLFSELHAPKRNSRCFEGDHPLTKYASVSASATVSPLVRANISVLLCVLASTACT